jgi:hypothetical protein
VLILIYFGENKMSDKRIPICWKCASKVMEPNKDSKFVDSLTLIGCKECKDIKTYSDAEKLCPLIFPPKNKVLITISDGGVVQLEYKPDNIEVEIRDFDIQGADEFPEDRPDCKKDVDGDWYQEMIFKPEKKELTPIEQDEPIKYINYYRCEDCNTEWQDEWSCQCDDECPVCAIPYSPYKSEDINKE